jgi:hypothetical protein
MMDDRMTDDLEGRGHSLMEVLSLHFRGGTE